MLVSVNQLNASDNGGNCNRPNGSATCFIQLYEYGYSIQKVRNFEFRCVSYPSF